MTSWTVLFLEGVSEVQLCGYNSDIFQFEQKVNFSQGLMFTVSTSVLKFTKKNALSHRQGTNIVFLPSVRDVHHEYVYPQPPYTRMGNFEDMKVWYTLKHRFCSVLQYIFTGVGENVISYKL